MKNSILIGICFLLLSTVADAETLFIHEVMKVTLRTGQGTDHKILSMIESGQMVTVLEKGEEWTNVRLPSGKEGSLLNRFLTTTTPTVILLKNLKREHKKLTGKYESLLEKNESSG